MEMFLSNTSALGDARCCYCYLSNRSAARKIRKFYLLGSRSRTAASNTRCKITPRTRHHWDSARRHSNLYGKSQGPEARWAPRAVRGHCCVRMTCFFQSKKNTTTNARRSCCKAGFPQNFKTKTIHLIWGSSRMHATCSRWYRSKPVGVFIAIEFFLETNNNRSIVVRDLTLSKKKKKTTVLPV